MKRQTHKFTVTVRFDRKCTESHAIREVRDCIHGTFYPTQRDDSEPGEFRVRTFGRVLKEKKSCFR